MTYEFRHLYKSLGIINDPEVIPDKGEVVVLDDVSYVVQNTLNNFKRIAGEWSLQSVVIYLQEKDT